MYTLIGFARISPRSVDTKTLINKLIAKLSYIDMHYFQLCEIYICILEKSSTMKPQRYFQFFLMEFNNL